MKVKIDQPNILEFDLDITNNSSINTSDPDVRFTIQNENINVSFPVEKQDGTYKVFMPTMKQMIDVGESECMIEVIVADRYFKAWDGKIEFEEAIKVEAKMKHRPNVETIKVTAAPVVKKQRVVKEEKKIKRKRKSSDTYIIDEHGNQIKLV
jgi:hypothetical protein